MHHKTYEKHNMLCYLGMVLGSHLASRLSSVACSLSLVFISVSLFCYFALYLSEKCCRAHFGATRSHKTHLFSTIVVAFLQCSSFPFLCSATNESTHFLFIFRFLTENLFFYCALSHLIFIFLYFFIAFVFVRFRRKNYKNVFRFLRSRFVARMFILEENSSDDTSDLTKIKYIENYVECVLHFTFLLLLLLLCVEDKLSPLIYTHVPCREMKENRWKKRDVCICFFVPATSTTTFVRRHRQHLEHSTSTLNKQQTSETSASKRFEAI